MIDYRVGDTRALCGELADGSVSLVATSPPFLALRSYLPAGHESKGDEIGSEPDPATFLDTLLAVTAEWGRVLAPWGSIAIELGDTYAGSGGAGGDYNDGGLRDGQNAFVGSSKHERRTDTKRTKVSDGTGSAIRDLHGKVQGGGTGWPRPKSLALIPQLYATSLAYGRNILTGAESPAGQWLVRNMIVWHRPNPAVGALGDKARPSTSYIVVATRSPKRWYDGAAVRGPGDSGNPDKERPTGNASGAPPLDCWFDEWDGSHDTWTLTTQPSVLAHYAMWPARLAERLVLSMCPAEVCVLCGEPRRRIEESVRHMPPGGDGSRTGSMVARMQGRTMVSDRSWLPSGGTTTTTTGWSDCGCGAGWVPGRVLDPFAGTFTTGLVSEFHGRDAIGFDLDSRNAGLVARRREEVRRALNPTHIRTIDGQQDLFGSELMS
jgi:hypothetical protein